MKYKWTIRKFRLYRTRRFLPIYLVKFLNSLPMGIKCADRPSRIMLELIQFVKVILLWWLLVRMKDWSQKLWTLLSILSLIQNIIKTDPSCSFSFDCKIAIEKHCLGFSRAFVPLWMAEQIVNYSLNLPAFRTQNPM